jgi:hypothetical protein
VSGWVLQALFAAKAAGLTVPDATLKAAGQFVDSCEDANNKGCYCYLPGAQRLPSMTSAGILSRRLLGVNAADPKFAAGLEYVKASPPGTTKNIYYEYYASRGLHAFNQEAWLAWFEGEQEKPGMRDYLLKSQDAGDKVPTQAGSWLFEGGPYTPVGGRIMCTSFALLCLETPYRYVPEWADLKKEP